MHVHRDENDTDIFRPYSGPSVSESECLTSDTISVSDYLNRIFMMSTSNHILSDMIDIIRI